MAESDPMRNSVSAGTFSIFPPFIPTLIKQRLTSSRFAPVKVEADSPSPATFSNAGDSTPRPSSAGSRSTARHSDDTYGEVSGSDDESNGSRNKGALGMVVANYEEDSGLRWNRVTPALNLLRHAGYEAQQPQCESRLVRTLYLNALAYLLSALPEDLTSEEAATIRSRLPEKMKSSVTTPLHSSPNGSANSPADRSYLHRLLASSIIWFCLILQYIMPFIKVLLVHLYQYERSHRVTERVTALALYAAEQVSRGGVSFGSTVLNMYDGKPGDAASNAASWWVEGIAGGIYEGVGEGMTILGFSGLNSSFETLSHFRREDDKSIETER